MSFLSNLFARKSDPRDRLRPLYDAVVVLGRDPRWYETGVPDTIDGRFEMVTAIIAHVLLRLEGDEDVRQDSAHLTEIFIDDMDAQLRQSGVGDLMVGKHIGKMMAALGGRLGAYRTATSAMDRAQTLTRNLGLAEHIVLDTAGARLQRLVGALATTPTTSILAGQLPEIG
ncbi:MAG: ubiquinol-cytochrome C chaperone family protein [Pseudomonadota bacterium]|mgnify:CR=1 FL=1